MCTWVVAGMPVKSFAAFAEHYYIFVYPARVYKPKDKALVEGGVKIIYTVQLNIFYQLHYTPESGPMIPPSHYYGQFVYALVFSFLGIKWFRWDSK